MTELWLEFQSDAGEATKIRVEQDRFTVGRHSGCDLSIPNSAVSREHLSIESFGDVFVVSDKGSSLGTKINGVELDEPVGFKNGDILLLGDEVEIRVQLVSETVVETQKPSTPQTSSSASSGSIPTSFFIIAPILVLVVLICGGGGLFIALRDGKPGAKTELEDDSTPREERTRETPKDNTSKTPETEKMPTEISGSETNANETPQTTEPIETPKPSTDSAKIEQISPAFLRKIVRNDSNAFLSSKQIAILAPKINQFKSSSALSANIKDARSSAAQISALSSSTNLTPQFLATAALAKLGNQRGNVAETAKSMVDVLEKLNRSIGVETSDEAMLVVAAYDQGVAGQFTQLRNAVEGLSGKSQGVTARQVRTIWFLHDQKRITDAEFEFALRFLAIGTITQKPSEFSVNGEALNF